jgi:site-specific DNA-methyltransferase (adenine-specific)
LSKKVLKEDIENRIINQDLFQVLDLLPDKFIDLIVVDPPYNLTKKFNESTFKEIKDDDYENWAESWISKLPRIMKDNASIYVCCDWKSSSAFYRVLSKYFKVRNRITWEREKGRGAKSNWKNCSEDIWFATATDDYFFDADSVKLKKKVIAPYRDKSGSPKDWEESKDGNYRLTFPSNIWTDITIPFWSMPENTEHPTQKPEKLIAKLIIASSKKGDFVFDPFLGSGTTSVVAKKLDRKFCGIEIDEKFALISQIRVENVNSESNIQGYVDGIFWERNSGSEQIEKKTIKKNQSDNKLFDVENLE